MRYVNNTRATVQYGLDIFRTEQVNEQLRRKSHYKTLFMGCLNIMKKKKPKCIIIFNSVQVSACTSGENLNEFFSLKLLLCASIVSTCHEFIVFRIMIGSLFLYVAKHGVL